MYKTAIYIAFLTGIAAATGCQTTTDLTKLKHYAVFSQERIEIRDARIKAVTEHAKIDNTTNDWRVQKVLRTQTGLRDHWVKELEATLAEISKMEAEAKEKAATPATDATTTEP